MGFTPTQPSRPLACAPDVANATPSRQGVAVSNPAEWRAALRVLAPRGRLLVRRKGRS